MTAHSGSEKSRRKMKGGRAGDHLGSLCKSVDDRNEKVQRLENYLGDVINRI